MTDRRDSQQQGKFFVLEAPDSRKGCSQVVLFIPIVLSWAEKPLMAPLSLLAANPDRWRAAVLGHI